MKSVIAKQLNIKISGKKGNFLNETVQELEKWQADIKEIKCINKVHLNRY
jgi:hypothetical protein